MSGAQHGYVDPSSADKVAVDETGEVDLQVLCLTGEGVTECVPCSMLGYDLRRLVSEKLPCKPGAKLGVYNGNAKVTLNQTLGEQGIVGKSAMLSCTYIPTNVCTAWNYVCGFPTCEREFALEGVTQLEGAASGEYLHNLPRSLARLTLGRNFNQSLEQVTLPSSLQSLSFGDGFSQSLEGVKLCKIAIESAKLECLPFSVQGCLPLIIQGLYESLSVLIAVLSLSDTRVLISRK